MSRLFVVCGLPATGKTTLAKALSKELNIVCLHKDIIKETLYDLLQMSNLDDSRKIGCISLRLLFKLTEEYLENNVDLIIESPFYFQEDIDLFKLWIEKYGIDLYCIVCEIDNEIRHQRFVTRPRHESHHDVDRLMEKKDQEVIDRLTFNYDLMPGKVFKVSTDKTSKKIIQNVREIFEL